jgi:integrase
MGKLSAKRAESIKDPGRHGDGDGLYLQVSSTGTRSWLVFFRWHGKRREMGLGAYPAISLAEARRKAEEAHRLVRQGIDPIEQKKRPDGSLFGAVADRFIAERVELFKNESHKRAWIRSLTHYAKPIRHIPVDKLATEDVARVVRPVLLATWPTGKKLRIHIAQVLDFARALGLRSAPNPAAWADNLDAILPPRADNEQHLPAMPWRDVPAFIAALRQRAAAAARLTEFTILTTCRSAEARGLTFAEIDRDERVWALPAGRSKTSTEHKFPLCDRATQIIEEMALDHDGHDDALIFPSPSGKMFSDAASARLMERMGVTGVTLHGFRSSFSDWAHEATNHSHEAIEGTLQHAIGSAVSRAYRRTDALDKRRALVTDWSAYCNQDCVI